MTEHKHQAVSRELLRTLISAYCSQSSAPSILLILKPGASRKALFYREKSCSMDQGRPKGVDQNSSCAVRLFLSPSPAWLLRILTLRALKGPVQGKFKGTSFRSVRETRQEQKMPFPTPTIYPNPHLPSIDSTIRKVVLCRSSHSEGLK